MTTFCNKCNCSEHESCIRKFHGIKQCRKCLLNNRFFHGVFKCDCGVWSKQTLKSLLSMGMMLPKCKICNKTIFIDDKKSIESIDDFKKIKETVRDMIKKMLMENMYELNNNCLDGFIRTLNYLDKQQ